jgi:hypothetical protein
MTETIIPKLRIYADNILRDFKYLIARGQLYLTALRFFSLFPPPLYIWTRESIERILGGLTTVRAPQCVLSRCWLQQPCHIRYKCQRGESHPICRSLNNHSFAKTPDLPAEARFGLCLCRSQCTIWPDPLHRCT